MSYSNFKDPIGLLFRMLFSGNKIAYSVLLREFLSKVLIPIDWFLKRSEKRTLSNTKGLSKDPMIFVLGGSRCGTTLLYQTLARYLPVSYIDNFTASFLHSPLSALKLFQNVIPRPKKSFKSYFGSVKGLGGANDGFPIWNRWLGEDRNNAPKDISQQSKIEMKKFFNIWRHISKKPFLNKNNRNSLNAPMFDAIFENSYFIEIYRNPIFVAQSLILSRRKVQGSDKIGWGLLSKDWKKSDDILSYIDDVCEQVYQVDKVLAEGRKMIDSKKYIRVAFEDFCKNPKLTVQKVGSAALNTKINNDELDSLEFSTSSNQQRLTDLEFERIKSAFERLNTINSAKNILVQ